MSSGAMSWGCRVYEHEGGVSAALARHCFRRGSAPAVTILVHHADAGWFATGRLLTV